MDHATRPFLGKGVVRVRATLHRIQSGVDVVPGGRAHRRGLETACESHPLLGKTVHVGSVGLASVAADVAKRAVVGDDEQEIRLCGLLLGMTGGHLQCHHGCHKGDAEFVGHVRSPINGFFRHQCCSNDLTFNLVADFLANLEMLLVHQEPRLTRGQFNRERFAANLVVRVGLKSVVIFTGR